MGDRQGRLSTVNLCPFVDVDLNLWPTVRLYSRHRADMDVKWTKKNIMWHSWICRINLLQVILLILRLWQRELESDLPSLKVNTNHEWYFYLNTMLIASLYFCRQNKVLLSTSSIDVLHWLCSHRSIVYLFTELWLDWHRIASQITSLWFGANRLRNLCEK